MPATTAPRRRRHNWWLQGVMDAYNDAVTIWEMDRELACNGYAAEMADFAERNPRPLLADFMRASRIH